MSDLPDVQPYLKSICNHYAQWWKDYAFMDEIDASTWFEFELTSRTEDKPKSSKEKPPDKLPSQPVLQAIENYANEKILIVGSSGAGKSTLLARIFWQAAERARHDETALIPVLVKLKDYQLGGDRSGIRGLILDSLESHDPSLDSDDLKKLLKQKRLLLLVDGLNELQQPQARTDLKSFCLNIPLIATARHAGDGWEIERKLELQTLSQHQVRDFLEVRLPTSDRARLQELSDRVQDFGQTPLMVWMLYCIFRTGNEIPETRGEAYRKFTNLYVERSKEGIDLDESRFLLSRLAFGMMQSQKPNDPTDFQLDISEVNAQNLLGSEKELKLLRDCHLLQSFGKSGSRRVRFCHQSLQEYYAAEYLLTQLPKLLEDQQGNNDLKSDYLNYLKWTEPVALMLALLDETQALRVVELALDVDLQLGSRLAGEVKPNFVEITLKLLDDISTSKRSTSRKLYIRLLGKSRADEATATLERALKDIDLMWVAIDALGEISSSKALNILFQAVQQSINVSENNYACEIILKLFSEICSQHTSNYLQQIAKNHIRSDVRAFAARELRNFSSDDVIQTLYEAALDEDDYVIQKASFALRTIGSQKAIDAEEKAARILYGDEFYDYMITMTNKMTVNPEMFVPSISKEVGTDSTQSIPKEIKSLQDYLKRHFNVEIEAHKTDDLLCLLEVLLDHADADLRLSAIWALGAIGDSQAVALLSKALADPNFYNRANAAGRLGHIANPSAIPLLIRAFNQEENISGSGSYVRGSIVDAIRDTKGAKALPFLEQLIRSNETELFTAILEAIGNITSPQSIRFLYEQLHLDKVKNVSDWMKTICEIQSSCKYYNCEIFQAHLEAQKPDRQTSPNSDRSPITQNFYASVNAVAGNVEGNLITPPPDSVE
jgi:HEAT repeat protein/energy-coupling factor transporter ATP-binding protein EcfA2